MDAIHSALEKVTGPKIIEAIVFISVAIVACNMNIVAGILFNQVLSNCCLLFQEIK